MIDAYTHPTLPAGNWICTDPGEGQYGRKISDYVFEYMDSRTPGRTIDIITYPISQIERTINSYGYTLFNNSNSCENIFRAYGTEAPMIIAECLFEENFASISD